MRARSRPSSSIRARRGSGEKNASGERIGSPMISRRLFPSGLPCLKSSSEAPGRPTTLNVGFGMYSEITLRTAIFVRPLTSTYLISPEYCGRQELREGVRRLVHVVVGVEDGKVDNGLWHGHLRDDGTVAAGASGARPTDGFQLRRQYYRTIACGHNERRWRRGEPAMQSFASMLHPDRLLPADPGVRRIARALYEGTKALPIVSPHGHCDPAAFAGDRPFDSPATELVTKDHYVLRMLYSQGVPLEALGVQPLDGTPAATDGRQIWRELATRYALFRGTPSKLWLDHTLQEVFGVQDPLDAKNADVVYDEISARLTQAGLPAACALRALRDRVPGHDRRRPRPARVARAAPPIRLVRARRADLPPRRRGRPRPARLPRPPRRAGRAHRCGHVELGRLSRRVAEPARRLRRGGGDRLGPRAPHTGHGRPVVSGRSRSVRAHRGRTGTAG